MSDKLDDFLNNNDIPEPSENARKTALNMASTEYRATKEKKNQKKFQGLLPMLRLMGRNNPNDRRSTMKNRKLFYGGMATAMVVVLAGGAALYQTRTHEFVTGADSSTNIMGYRDSKAIKEAPTTGEIRPSYKEAIDEFNETGEEQAVQEGESFIPVPTAPVPETRSLAKHHTPQTTPPMAKGLMAQSDSMIAPYPPQPYPMPEPMPPQKADNDKFEKHDISAVKQVSQEPVSTFSVDVDTASYSFMRRQLENGILPNPNAVRIEELINYFPYNYQGPDSAKTPFKANVAVVNAPWKEGNKLIHIGIKGYDIETDVQPRANLVFLLDVSGSMNQPDKLPLLKNSFRMLLNTLQHDDTVSIVTYAGSSGVALPPTNVAEKEKIAMALMSLGANGSTAGAAGIEQAYALAEQNFDEEAVNRVILATDGDFNVGMNSNDELKELIEKKRESGIFLSVLGFGQGNLNDHLMQTLAQNGNGIAAHIDSLSEAQKVLVDEATSSLFPIAKDVKLQVEFNPDVVSEYRLIGYETRALNREDFNNDKVDAGDIGAGHSVTAIYEITPKGSNNELYGESRYETAEKTKMKSDFGNEYAFLKMRYKLPDEDTSTLITTPISTADEKEINNETAFALSVAGFGQLIKNDKFLSPEFDYEDVLRLAQKGKGVDPYGYRAEFIRLVRLAETLDKTQ